MPEQLTKLLRNLAPVAVAGFLLTNFGQFASAQRPLAETRAATAGFVNKVWKVSKRSDGTSGVGTLYVFLSGGALAITSPNSKPTFGSWKYTGGVLTMVEDVPYKVDVLRLTRNEFKIRIKSPREPLTITFVPAARLR